MDLATGYKALESRLEYDLHMHPHAVNYSQIVDSIFGPGSSNLNSRVQSSSPVIGALASTTDFEKFRRNFISRLTRLNESYQGHASRQALLTQVNQVADPQNWQGAVAELAAYDLFNSKRDFLGESPELDVIIDVNNSLGRFFGMQEANLDIHFRDFDVFMDIKVLKDNVTEILYGIKRQVLPNPRPPVIFEYPRDIGYELLQSKRQQILNIFQIALGDGNTPGEIDFTHEVPGLVARISWNQGIIMAESSYSPFKHAEELHKLSFHHAKKFVTSHPFILTFVVFPWFNSVIHDFCEANTIFYRAFARRVFCQYQADPTAFSLLAPRYSGSESISEVSKYLGGIFFAEDHSIEGDEPNDTNIKGFYYENPNAILRPSEGIMDMYLRQVATSLYDDFRHDNY